MEYLKIRGAVELKEDVDKAVLVSVLGKLSETEFVDAGYVDISLKGRALCIHAEGTIPESYSIRALLPKLQDQLANTSIIGISCVRWETLIVLKCWAPRVTRQRCISNQLALAQ